MNPKSKQVWKWVGIGVGSIGGGGVIISIFFFALNSYIANEVQAQTALALEKVPTVETITNQFATVNDGIGDNTKAIDGLKNSQDEFRLLFIDYLRTQAEE